MNNLIIKNFKAFSNRIYFNLGNPPKNMIVFGENGSGKSSVYEAIKLCFFRERLLKPYLTVGSPKEQRDNEERDFYRSYNHRVPAGAATTDFTLEVNGNDFKTFSTTSYQCFMISPNDLDNKVGVIDNGKVIQKDIINLPSILRKAFIPVDDIASFLNANMSAIVTDVNNSLKIDFIEDIEIGRENEEFDIFIKNQSGALRESNGVHEVFNEAKVNLVVMLLLFHCILKLKKDDASNHRLLVLDDLVTSLDASNRKFLISFIISKFGDFQKVLFIHNLGFNNLFYKIIHKKENPDNWVFQNIYITNRGPQQYYYDEFGSANEILDQFNRGLLQPDTVGNVLRKRFEADIYELAKEIEVGEVHQATALVGRLLDPARPLYVRKKDGKYLGSDDLVKDIEVIINGADTPVDKIQKITKEITKYATDADLLKIVNIIKEMHFYEKIMIHQLSHGATAMPSFNQKEVEDSLKMIVSLEALIKQYLVSNGNSWNVMM